MWESLTPNEMVVKAGSEMVEKCLHTHRIYCRPSFDTVERSMNGQSNKSSKQGVQGFLK